MISSRFKGAVSIIFASFGAASGAPPKLKIGDLAKKSLYVTRPGLGPHTATPQLTEEISSPLFLSLIHI